VIVNGRINTGSVRLLRGLSRFQPALWDAVAACCARSAEDAVRFASAGLATDRIESTGSLKYDTVALEPDHARREALARLFALAPDAPVIIAGNTAPGEEEALYRIYCDLQGRFAGLRLIAVPRHIERATAVARALQTAGARVLRKTDLDAGRAAAQGDEVVLVDTIGDLAACWSLSTCAFVGRSLYPPGGGQNMMEPAALGCPVLVGPHTGNFRPEMQLLTARRAVLVVHGEAELRDAMARLLADEAEAARLGGRARRAILESRGATEKTLARLEEVIARS
jgi:3-deoxy-D-manno-octulosonic-acid transferase